MRRTICARKNPLLQRRSNLPTKRTSEATTAGGGLYDELREHVNDMFETVIEGEARPRSLRSSSLPYCPVLDVLVTPESDRMDLSKSLYTSIGTAAHLSLQVFATLGKYGPRCWGGWKCPRCAHEWKTPRFRPDRCPSGCDDPPLYEEACGRGIMGWHSDLVVRYPHGWLVQEYKTIGRKPTEPQRKHVLQARTYCHMLREEYGIDAAYAIVYVERPHLARTIFGPYDPRSNLQEIADWTKRSIVGFRAATVARERPTPPNLREVARLRPCHDRASYDEYMARNLDFAKNTCPLLSVCSTSTERVARQMHAMLTA